MRYLDGRPSGVWRTETEHAEDMEIAQFKASQKPNTFT